MTVLMWSGYGITSMHRPKAHNKPIDKWNKIEELINDLHALTGRNGPAWPNFIRLYLDFLCDGKCLIDLVDISLSWQ